MSLVAEITCRWICDRCKRAESETCRQHVVGVRQLLVSPDDLFDVTLPPAGWQVVNEELLCEDCLAPSAVEEVPEPSPLAR